MGAHCTQGCPAGRFGPDCAHECFCHNGANCNKVDGRCLCQPGFMGSRCQFECTEGLYGQDCAHTCSCPSANHICSPIAGCMCPLSYQGPNCTQPTVGPSPTTWPDQGARSGQPGIIFGAIVGVVFMLASIFLICFLRRRYKGMKSEHAQTLYIAASEGDGRDIVFQYCFASAFTVPHHACLPMLPLARILQVEGSMCTPCRTLRLPWWAGKVS